MARNVEIDVIANDKTASAIRGASKNFDGLRKKVRETSDEGSSMGRKLASGFGSALTSLPGMLVSVIGTAGTAGVAAAVAVGPLIGAALVAGILGALSVGLIGIGFLIVKSNPRIQKAMESTKKVIGNTLKDAAAPLIPEFEKAITFIGTAFKGAGPQLKEMFTAVKPLIMPLTQAFTELAKNALPGVITGLKASVPIILKIAEKAPAMGTAISKFFTIIAQYGPQAADLIGRVMDAITWLIPVIARVIGWITSFYSTMINAWRSIINAVRTGVSNASASFNAFIAAAGRAKDGVVSRFNSLVAVVRSIPGRIRSALGNLGGLLVAAGRALIQGLINGINAMLGRVRSAIASVKSAVSGLGGILPFGGAPGGFQFAFAGGPGFAAGTGFGRTEPPRPITNVDVAVQIDGQSLDARTRTIVRGELNAQAHRARVGRR